jgi:translation initiation factor 2 subunit 2
MSADRILVPIPEIEVKGKKTMLKNFNGLAKAFRREPRHFSKYLSKKLATHGSVHGGMLEFQGIFSKDEIRKEIENYLKDFVYCMECFRLSNKLCPDTHIIKEGNSLFLECEACGSKYLLKDIP